MDCREAKGLFDGALEGTLGVAGEERLHAHLESCAACRAQYELLLSIEEELGARIVKKAPERLTRRIIERVERRYAWNRRVNWVASIAAAFAALSFVLESLRRGWYQKGVEALAAGWAGLTGRIDALALSLFGEASPEAAEVTTASLVSVAGALFLVVYLIRFLRENGGEGNARAAEIRK